MENKRKGKWMPRRVISWLLTVIMVVGTFAYGGIPGARNVQAVANYGADDCGFIEFSTGTLAPNASLSGAPSNFSISLYQKNKNTGLKGDAVASDSFSITYTWDKSGAAVPGQKYTLKVKVAGAQRLAEFYKPLSISNVGTTGNGTYKGIVTSESNYGTDYGTTAENEDWEYVVFTIEYTVASNTLTAPIGGTVTYDGSALDLLSQDASATYLNGGSIQYQVKSGTTVISDWGSTAQATNAGTYQVYYRVSYANNDGTTTTFGGNNYVTSTINKRPVTLTPTPGQDKIYGQIDDDVFTYTLSEKTSTPTESGVIPADLNTLGMFDDVTLYREVGENYKKNGYKYTFTQNETERAEASKTKTTDNYIVTLNDDNSAITYMINRKNMAEEDIILSLTDRDKTKTGDQDNIIEYDYYYNGGRITPTLSISYNAQIESIKNKALVKDTDYNIENGDSVQEFVNEGAENPYTINVKGKGNYIGVASVDWRIIRNDLGTITAGDYEDYYDGKEHSITLDISESNDPSSEITYIYDKDNPDKDYSSAEAWDEELAKEENPTFTNAGTYTVYYKIHSKQVDENYDGSSFVYNDVYGSKTVTINKKPVELTAVDKNKVYDNDANTDPTLKILDYSSQMVGDEKLDGIVISREEGQNAGKYAISLNIAEINTKNPNYSVTQVQDDTNKGYLTITPRPVKVTVGDYEKTYSEVNPKLAFNIEQVGDEGVAADTGLISGDVLFPENSMSTAIKAKKADGTYQTFDRFIDAGEYTFEPDEGANKNYAINLTSGKFTVKQKDISDVNTNVLIICTDSTRKYNTYKYTGSTIEPTIVLSDKQDDVEYVNHDGDDDFYLVETSRGSEYGTYTVHVKGKHNYKGIKEGKWAILPTVSETYDYDGKEHELEFDFGASMGEDGDGTVKEVRYSAEAEITDATFENASETAPKFVDAGVHTVYYALKMSGPEYGAENDFVVGYHATVTIKKAPLTINIGGTDKIFTNKTYDGTVAAPIVDANITFGNADNTGKPVNGETITFAKLVGTFDTKDVAYAADGKTVVDKTVVLTEEQIKAATVTVTRAAGQPEQTGGTINNYEVTYNFDAQEPQVAGDAGDEGEGEEPEAPVNKITGTAKITPNVVTINATANKTKVYDGTADASNPVLTITPGTAVAGESIVSEDFEAFYNDKNVGENKTISYTATLSMAGENKDTALLQNYAYKNAQNELIPLTANSFDGSIYQINDAAITAKAITATVSAVDKTYDGTTKATATVTINTGIEGETIEVSDVVARFATKDVALVENAPIPYAVEHIKGQTVTIEDYALTVNKGTNPLNYKITTPTTTAKIYPAQIDVSVDAKDKVYDGDNKADGSTITIKGIANNNLESGYEEFKLAEGVSLEFASKDVAYAEDDTVKAQAITIPGEELSGKIGNIVAKNDATIEKLTNYALTALPTAEAKINPRPVELKADNKLRAQDGANIVYGEPAEALTYQEKAVEGDADSGMVQGENLASVTTDGGNPTLSREAGNDVGTYEISFDEENISAANPNYAITFTNGTYTIVPAEAEITNITADEKYYDGTDAATVTITISGVNDEEFTVSDIAGKFASKDVAYDADGIVKKQEVTITGIVSDGTEEDHVGKVSNYKFNGIVIEPGVVTELGKTTNYIWPKNVNLVIDSNQNKVYGDDDPEFTWTETGLVEGETLKDVDITRAEGESVGSYEMSIDTDKCNASNKNYNVGYFVDYFKINTRPVTITVDANQSKQYDGQEVATANLKYTIEAFDADNHRGLKDGDEIGVTIEKAAGVDAGEYDVTLGTTTGTSNYEVALTNGTYTIERKTINVTAEDKSKTYGEEDPEFTWTVDELVAPDSSAGWEISAKREAGENAGTYKITPKINNLEPKNLNAAYVGYDNYDIVCVDGTFTIDKADTDAVPDKDKISTTKASSTTSKDATMSGVDDTMEYSTDGGKTWTSVPTGKTSVSGLSAGEVQVRKKGDANHNPGEAVKVTVPQKAGQSSPSSTTVKGNAASGTNASDGTITGVDDTMEYSTDGGKTWTSVPKGATKITGLKPGIVQVRKKATADKNASEAISIVIRSNAQYKGEWRDGQWYDKDGNTNYMPKGSWKKNSTGWWYEDSSGWYPRAQWQKIDGLWYYFDASGYMASNEWIDGWWLDSDGAWRYTPQGSWKVNSTGWWYEDTSGWYPKAQWQKIDGRWYYFHADGYMAASTTIDIWTVGADGAWVE